MLVWRHRGFTVHNQARVAAGDARRQVAGAPLQRGGRVLANRRTIVKFAAQHRLPAMYSRASSPRSAAMSNGVYYPHLYYRAASYVDKILRAPSPATLPRELLLRADEVIR